MLGCKLEAIVASSTVASKTSEASHLSFGKRSAKNRGMSLSVSDAELFAGSSDAKEAIRQAETAVESRSWDIFWPGNQFLSSFRMDNFRGKNGTLTKNRLLVYAGPFFRLKIGP